MNRETSGISLAELAARTGATLDGEGATLIRRVGTLERAERDAIAFLANPKYRARLATTRAGAVIVAATDATATSLPKLVSANPYATYARVAALLHPETPPVPGVHATAIVDASAQVAADASIGPGCVIGAEVSIGERTTLYANVVVYPRCVIGARTMIHAGVVIGADGFGMAAEGDRWLRVPQLGRVIIGDDCEVGANTTIDRGAIDDTVIEDGVKLDNQIQIGHNCTIGRHTAIAGCVGIAGSTRIGRNCRIGGAAMISGHLEIPDGSTVSAGTFIASTPDAPGIHTGVFPALPHRHWRRIAAQLRHLDELVERVRALERARQGDE